MCIRDRLLEGKSVNIEGLGVFMLTARSKGAELAKDINAKSCLLYTSHNHLLTCLLISTLNKID